MLEKLVENWFDRANERSYQIPFCQVLASEGHQVVYVSPHGILEQGKDVITIAPDKSVYAYQLKTGNVTQAEWRNTIRGEVVDLCELPIRHPSIEAKADFRPVLVCSGELADSVRNDITALNESHTKRNIPRLATITRGELLARFIAAHGKFFPIEPLDFHEFLELYLADGRNMLNKSKLSGFLTRLLDFHGDEKKPREYERLVAASCVLFGYLLGRQAEARNHLAVAEGWLTFAFHVAGFAESRGLKAKLWKATFDLALLGALSALKELVRESIARDHFSEGNLLVDGPLYRHRATVVMGWIAGLEMFQRMTGNRLTDHSEIEIVDFLSKHIGLQTLVSEWSVPHIMFANWTLGTRGTEGIRSENRIAMIIKFICTKNGRQAEGEPELPNSYYDLDATLEFQRSQGEERGDSFKGRSMTTGLVVDWLARRLRKGALASLWYDLTAITHEWFEPVPATSAVLWRTASGTKNARMFARPQAWDDLLKEAQERGFEGVPTFLQDNPGLCVLFVLAYPHRFNRHTLAVIERGNSKL